MNFYISMIQLPQNSSRFSTMQEIEHEFGQILRFVRSFRFQVFEPSKITILFFNGYQWESLLMLICKVHVSTARTV